MSDVGTQEWFESLAPKERVAFVLSVHKKRPLSAFVDYYRRCPGFERFEADDGDTALHIASRFSSPEIIKILHSRGADLEAKNDVGRTPLHEVMYAPQAEALIQCGADVNARDVDGLTPLHVFAVISGAENLVEVALRHGADRNAVAENGVRPIDRVSDENESVRALLLAEST